MRSLKIFALAAAGLAVLATGHARAADLPPMLPPPPVIQEYGGWYLRGDIGMTNQKVRFRWDIIGEYRGETGFHGFDTWTDGAGDPRFNDYSAKKSEWLLMWNAYLDLGTWHNITPFIGADIGAARVGIHSFRDRGIDSVANGSNPTMAYANSPHKWNFAWALHAGLAYDVTPNFTVELAYRYLNMGDGKSGDIIAFDGTNDIDNPMHFKKLTSHDIKFGVRWALADMGVSHWQPEQPIYSKY
jgi:opacity protein-like surface antigen